MSQRRHFAVSRRGRVVWLVNEEWPNSSQEQGFILLAPHVPGVGVIEMRWMDFLGGACKRLNDRLDQLEEEQPRDEDTCEQYWRLFNLEIELHTSQTEAEYALWVHRDDPCPGPISWN